MNYEKVFSQMRVEILERLESSGEVSDKEVHEQIDELLAEWASRLYLSLDMRRSYHKELFNSLRRLDILQELLDDDEVTEIMVNGAGHIFLEKNGCIRCWHKQFSSMKRLEDVIQQIVGRTNRRVNEASPIVDTRLANGDRVNVVLPPVAPDGPVLTIRRFPKTPISMKQLIAFGSISKECASFLKQLVRAGYNIFISGGTGSGKTTFLNVLSDFIPKEERVITIEDSAELQLQQLPNLVRLETRMPNAEGANEISMRALIRTSLRMRPDRIVVGEVRGSEAIDMLQALNTGHDGSLSTGHANSPEDMLARLETMVLMGMELPLPAVRRQIASGIDILVHLGRIRDRTRKVLEICEVTGFADGEIQLSSLYRFVEEGTDATGKVKGTLQQTGALARNEKLRAAGLIREKQ